MLHASRNFIFWFLAFIFADYLVAYYWIDVQSLIQQQPFGFFKHSNTALPQKIESALARVLITPNIHRLHHSIVPVEHDSNYGEWLVFWDKLFDTFRHPVLAKPDSYGVNMLTDEKYQTIKGMMLTPFRHDLHTQ